jgi:transketolase
VAVAARADGRTGGEGDAASLAELDRLSVEARRLILRSIHAAGAGHVGGPLSCADLLVNLYFDRLNVDPGNPGWPERDRCILSKGHSSIALYAVLALRGFLPVAELATFDAADSRLQGHPDMTALPGLDMSTGSLGQGLSPGVGMALGARLRGLPFRTWVIVGDGEIQEGQIWEAAFTAARLGLDTLCAIVDYNRLPQFGWPDPGGFTRTEPVDDPDRKVPGLRLARGRVRRPRPRRDPGRLRRRRGAPRPADLRRRPHVKGKGISFAEGDYLWHAKVPTPDDLERAGAEFDARLARLGDRAGGRDATPELKPRGSTNEGLSSAENDGADPCPVSEGRCSRSPGFSPGASGHPSSRTQGSTET